MELGRIQKLTVEEIKDQGAYLIDSSAPLPALPEQPRFANRVLQIPHILLPKNQCGQLAPGDPVTVFVYKDSSDRPIATTTLPPLELGGIAELTVTQVTRIGAFLSWGLAKDLLLPFHEQTSQVKEGDSVLAALYIDKSSRLCATMKLYPYLRTDSPYHKDDRVSGRIYETSNNFGVFVAVDGRYSAMIPKREVFFPLLPGQPIEARVARVLEDGKLTLSLRDKAYLQMDGDSELIYSALRGAGGYLPYHDKSSADEIKARFGMGKNAFKRALGHLYKEKRITIETDGIRLVPPEER